MAVSQKDLAVQLDAAPARFLDQFEELRMDLSDEKLINEAIEVNYPAVGDERTVDRYQDHLVHFSQYLASVHGATFYTARKKHVRLFMVHLEKAGGAKPHQSRLSCEWCRMRGYPDGRSGSGWSASYRKSYLSALRFLYKHFQSEEDLPDIDPTTLEASPKISHRRGYTPTREDIKKLMKTAGTPRARLLTHWTFYAPSRRQTFSDALWTDLDLDLGTWEVMGKGKKPDTFFLAPPLVREFRAYRRWQLAEAERIPGIRYALSNPETAYVLLTRTGRKTHPATISRILKRQAIHAGVGVKIAESKWEAVNGMTSSMSCHAMRRGWASTALNDDEQPIDVVSEVLKHEEISTTRRHYAPTKSDRANAALVNMRI